MSLWVHEIVAWDILFEWSNIFKTSTKYYITIARKRIKNNNVYKKIDDDCLLVISDF